MNTARKVKATSKAEPQPTITLKNLQTFIF